MGIVACGQSGTISMVTYKSFPQVFNVSDRSYDTSKFNNQVLDFGWPDHLAPSLARLSRYACCMVGVVMGVAVSGMWMVAVAVGGTWMVGVAVGGMWMVGVAVGGTWHGGFRIG